MNIFGYFLDFFYDFSNLDCSAPFVVGIRTNEQFVDDSGEAADFEENLSLGICLEYSQEPC